MYIIYSYSCIYVGACYEARLQHVNMSVLVISDWANTPYIFMCKCVYIHPYMYVYTCIHIHIYICI